MSYLVDTTVLLRLRDSANPHHDESLVATQLVRAKDVQLVICAQVLTEYWVVLTRPCDANGCGLTFDEAVVAIGKVRAAFRCLAEPPDIADRWQQMVVDNKVMGKQAHDARIATIMLAHGIKRILTYNTSDFSRYEGITPVTPQDVVQSGCQ